MKPQRIGTWPSPSLIRGHHPGRSLIRRPNPDLIDGHVFLIDKIWTFGASGSNLYTLDILFESCGAFCYGLFCCRREGKKSTCVFPSIKGKFIWKFRKPDCACCCVCACERASHFLTAFLKNWKKTKYLSRMLLFVTAHVQVSLQYSRCLHVFGRDVCTFTRAQDTQTEDIICAITVMVQTRAYR
jgi:hypothetical protein